MAGSRRLKVPEMNFVPGQFQEVSAPGGHRPAIGSDPMSPRDLPEAQGI